MTATTSPRIYVACLSSYNNGKLHGRWIDAAFGEDHINDEIKAMLSESTESPAEEWAIHDYEGFGSYKLNEYESIETVAELAEFIEEHENVARAALSNYCNLDDAKRHVEDGYSGRYSSVTEYAEQLFDDCYGHQIPENLRNYIDYEAFGRDLELGGDIDAVDYEGYCYIFDGTI